MVAVQPTRGLDVGGDRGVHGSCSSGAKAGTAILLISEDLDEILALSDRVDVMYEGRIVGLVRRRGGRHPRDRPVDDRRREPDAADERAPRRRRPARARRHEAPPRATDRRAALVQRG